MTLPNTWKYKKVANHQHYMTLYDIIWHYMTLYDIIWHYMTLYDIIWHHMTLWYVSSSQVMLLSSYVSVIASPMWSDHAGSRSSLRKARPCLWLHNYGKIHWFQWEDMGNVKYVNGNFQITISWENSICLWPVSMAMLNYQTVIYLPSCNLT